MTHRSSSWSRPLVVLTLWLLGTLAAHAADLTPVPVADGVYALIGPTGPRTDDNDALNANLGFVVTGEGLRGPQAYLPGVGRRLRL